MIFDWGGTLTTPDLAAADLGDLWRLAAEHLHPARAEDVVATLVAVDRRFWERTTTSFESWRLADILAAASLELGLDVTDAVLEEAATRHLDGWTTHIHHEADAADVLRALRSAGLRIGLLSNTNWPRSFHEHFLERDGLSGLIDARLYTSELGYVKPHPSVFRAAAEAIGVDAAACAFVGDRPYDDIHGGRQAGMRTVLREGADVPSHPVVPDATIRTLSELVHVVSGWVSTEG